MGDLWRKAMAPSENENDKTEQLEELRDAEETSKQQAEEKARAALDVRFNGGDEEQ